MTRVVLTLPSPRADRLAARLAERGHEVVSLSFRRLVSEGDSPEVRRTFARLEDFDWVVFVSPGAIAAASPALPDPWPVAVGVAVVGPGSTQALRDAGIDTRLVRCVVPERAPFDADALMRLAPFDAPEGRRVLVVAGDRGRSDWIAALGARGARVDRLRAYRNEDCAPDARSIMVVGEWAARSHRASFVFTSVDTVDALARLAAVQAFWPWASRQPAFVSHPRIAAALAAAGWHDRRTIDPGERALFAALESA